MSDMQQTRPFNVRATYSDMDAARRGLEVLENAGIDAADISLQGPAAEKADTTEATATKDAAMLNKGFKTSVGGAVVGALTGGVIGLIAGVLAFGGLSVGALALMVGLGAAGAGVGLLVNNLRVMRQSEQWEATLDEHGNGGTHVVGAYVDSEDAARKAGQALAHTQPSELSVLDAHGNPVDSLL